MGLTKVNQIVESVIVDETEYNGMKKVNGTDVDFMTENYVKNVIFQVYTE